MKSVLWPIVRQAIQSPNKVVAMDDRRRYTFTQLLGGSMFLADQIDLATSASHVGILLPTSGSYAVALMGTWLAKRVAVPLNYLLSPEELVYVIGDSDIDTIITVGPMLDFLKNNASNNHEVNLDPIPPGIKLIHIDQLDFSGVPPFRWPPCNSADDLAVILYTSGTSGRPKGVMLTHGNLRSNVEAAVQHANLTKQDTFIGVLPQFHSFGLTALTILPLYIGAKAIYTARFIPKKIISLIRQHKPNILVAVPSMYSALLSVKNAQPEDFKSIRLAVSGGEPLPQATFDQYRNRFDLSLLEGYGLTETAPMTNWCTPECHRLRSVGRTLPGVTVIVVDDHNHPLPLGQEGEILIAGPNIMKGYYKLPKQTHEVFVDLVLPAAVDEKSFDRANDQPKKSRFFRTGDIGHLDEKGYLYITGRKKEMLIIGGENVFPREIEEVLNKHTSVNDSAVIGKTDDMRGEVPIAFIELAEGQVFDETLLRSWCRDRLANYKVPREIRLIDVLPRNPTGKILRRNLPKD